MPVLEEEELVLLHDLLLMPVLEEEELVLLHDLLLMPVLEELVSLISYLPSTYH
jgi:hypothetical protein